MATPPDLEVVVARLDAGERVKVIAADLGVTPRTIRDWLHAAGLPLASTLSRQRRRSLLADPSWLRRQHVDEGLSAWAIGNELEIPTAEVRAILEGFGIERPPAHPELNAEALRTAFAGGATVTSIASTAGGVQRWAERGGDPIGNDEQDLRRPLELANDGDSDAAELMDETIEILAIGLANLVNLVNPEVIVLGGWVGADLARQSSRSSATVLSRVMTGSPSSAARRSWPSL